jgi:hypothetical protein
MQVVASLISTKNYTINGSAASSSNTFDINFLRDEYDFYLNSSLFEPITTGTAINTSITFNYYETLDEYPDVTSFTIIDSDAGDYVSIAAGDTDYTYKLVISRNIPVGEYHFKFKSRSLLPDGRLVEHTHGPYELDGRTKSNYTLIVTSA